MLKLLNRVICNKQNLELFQLNDLKSVQVLQIIIRHIQELYALNPKQSSLLILRLFDVQSVKSVISAAQDFQLEQGADTLETGHVVIVEAELFELRCLA